MKRHLTFILTLFILSCKNEPKKSGENNSEFTTGVQTINYAVTNTFPHDTSLFTEGFLIHGGQFFESTGSPKEMVYTRSLIGIDDLKTGKFDTKVEIDKRKYFGEGIVFFNDKLYQLTYKNKTGFIYDAKSFKQLGKFSYANAEGWSLTTNGKELIMTDGTENITF